MAIQFLALFSVAVWLLYRALSTARSPVTTSTTSAPVHKSLIPFLGPLVAIIFRGSNEYISSLCALQDSSISTLKLPGQDIHLIHPHDSHNLKQFVGMNHLSLMAVFRVAVGPAMGLVPASEKFLTDPDSGVFKRKLSKLFNDELRGLRSLRTRAAQIEKKIGKHWDEKHRGQECVKLRLGHWLFDMLSRSMGSVFWGDSGPFEKADFRDNLRLFIENLEALSNPVPFLVPRDLKSARATFRMELDQAIEKESYGGESQDPTLFHRLSGLYETLKVPQEAFADCHLVAIVGLMSNVIHAMTWIMCHILADQELKDRILAELEASVGDQAATQPVLSLTIDIQRVRESCPTLLATWYELLRMYGDSPVARYVYQDSVFDGKFQIRRGSIIMTPIRLSNFDENTWGPDVHDFRPDRFLNHQGRVNQALVKHLTVFGLPGMHQCPGRSLGHTLIIALVAKILLTFDIAPSAPGKPFVPKRKETNLGLPAMKLDPEITVTRRRGAGAVHAVFDNVSPGW